MGKVYLNPIDKKSIERRDKMSNETKKQTIDSIKSVDSMKAVKVAYDLTAETMTSMETLASLVKNNTDNLNLLAVKILKLEKILARYQMTEGLDERSKD